MARPGDRSRPRKLVLAPTRLPLLAVVLAALVLARLGLEWGLPPPEAWRPVGPEGAVVLSLALLGERDVLAGTTAGLVAGDGAGRWRPFGPPDLPPVRTILPVGDVLWIGTERGLFFSPDAGQSWRGPVTPPGAVPVNALATAGGILAAATDTGLVLSRDRGATWAERRVPAPVLALLALPSGAWLSGTAHGLLQSADAVDWLPAAPSLADRTVTGLAVGPDGTFYAALAGPDGGLFWSTDGGRTWQRGEVASDAATTVLADPFQPRRAYAGLAGLADGQRIAGVVVTEDGGATWRPIKTALVNTTVPALALDHRGRLRLWAGTNGGGVYWYEPNTPVTGVTRQLVALLRFLEPASVGLLLLALFLALGQGVSRRGRHGPPQAT